MNSNISSSALIIGCGWIGKKLGSYLSEQGVQVSGTTRSKEKFEQIRSFNIKPFLLDVSPNPSADITIPEADTVFISISPGRGGDRSLYPLRLGSIASKLRDSDSQVILFSSTSAYEGRKGLLTENDAVPDERSDNIMLQAEGMILKDLPDAVILRFGGLYGPDRHPVKYLAGRTDLKEGDAPVNLIHCEDITGICSELMQKHVCGEIFNLCADHHPSRSDLYTHIAEKRGLEKPVFLSGGSEGKIVSNQKVKEVLNYSFRHADPMMA